MKFNIVSLYWYSLRSEIFNYHHFFKIISLHLNPLKFQLKADYQSHAITLDITHAITPYTLTQLSTRKCLLLYTDST